MLKLLLLLTTLIATIYSQGFPMEFEQVTQGNCDYTTFPYEEFGANCISHDSECDDQDGYNTFYQESCDDGYGYQEDCRFDDFSFLDMNSGTCNTKEYFEDFTNTCFQTFEYEEYLSRQITRESCTDSDGGYDRSLEIFTEGDSFWESDFYRSFSYFYVEEGRNLSGTCLTDTENGIRDQCTKSYQYQLTSVDDLTFNTFDDCPIPPVYEGCFCNCTHDSDDGNIGNPTCKNVGNCNDDNYVTLQRNFENVELTAEACGCGQNPEMAMEQDEEGFIELLGEDIHCPTICWEQKNIYDLLEDSEIIPLTGNLNLTLGDISP